MWQHKNDSLYNKFEFANFKKAHEFIGKVASLAESQNHHPKILNDYNNVEIWLSTHSAGNKVTDKDKRLAEAIDELIETSNLESNVEINTTQLTDKSKTKTTKVRQHYPKAKLFTDGGSRGNPGPSASAYILFDEHDQEIEKGGKYIGLTTNNQAEYQALRYGLERAHSLGVRHLRVFMDSLLAVNQLKGIYKVKNRELWPVHQSILEFCQNFADVEFSHIPRELNKFADSEVNRILDENGH